MSGIDSLDDEALWAADRAFLDAQASGNTTARCVRAALAAYVQHAEVSASRRSPAAASPEGAVVQYLATIPDDHPDLAGGQILVRSFDGGDSWEVCTRPDTYSTWSVGVQVVSA